MPIQILMPALSPTMEEGNLAKWLVKPGDKVSSGDVIAEIETDKATMEVEAVDEGTIGKILVDEGTEGVAVNKPIAVLLEDGEDASALEGMTSGETGGSAAPTVSSDETPAPAQAPAATTTAASPALASGGAPMATATAGPVVKDASGNRILASPLARRIAKELGVDLSTVKGSGPHGRIIKADVEAAPKGVAQPAASEAAAPAPPSSAASAPLSTGMSDDQILKLFEEGSYELQKHDNMRKTIARRLTEAKQTVPHFYLTIDTRIDALLKLRAELNASAPKDADGKPAYKLSVNDMVIKAHALALRDVPDANSSWSEGGMLMHKNVDVGVAVSIEGGLITPIIRRAEEKTLSKISTEMKDLAGRARTRKLQPQEYQGGTTAVSNLGMFGVKDFCAVINPPHATILAVGAGIQQPVVADGAVQVATVMSVTLSTDHRAVDGALGAQLLQSFKGYIENPMSMLV